MSVNLVFYDGTCGLCDHIVQFIIKQDHKKIFLFAPLQGITAEKLLKDLPAEYKTIDSLVLIENFNTPHPEFTVMGKAAFCILWLLGGKWALLGWMTFLPPWLYNWGYRFVARNRHKLFSNVCQIITPETHDRFLK